jgi:hypothetical protein
MNERIKELYEQSLIRERGKDHAGNPMLVIKQNPKKFAELIIRECAEVCYGHSNAAGGIDTDFGYGYKDCGDDIKRNFGVEL